MLDTTAMINSLFLKLPMKIKTFRLKKNGMTESNLDPLLMSLYPARFITKSPLTCGQ